MTSSGHAAFDRYHDEFRMLIRQIEGALHDQEGTAGDADNGSSTDLSQQLQECRKLLTPMKVEARGASDESWKQTLMDIVQACEMQLASYEALSNNRTELFGTRDEIPTSKASYENCSSGNSRPVKLFEATQEESVARQNAQLANALRSIQQTEEVAADIGTKLNANREKLGNSQKNVLKLSEMTEQANGMVTKMLNRWF
eukprot:scaffold5886_cov161-Amphora_coffeaeformis.AAC.4